MPKVTSVEPQKQNPRRFNIFLDGVFAFGADEDLVVNFRLVIGKEIQPQDLDKILFEAKVGKLMEKMYGLFSIRQRSEAEIRKYFRIKNHELRIKNKKTSTVITTKVGIYINNEVKGEISDIVIESLIQKLKDKGLIDDLKFAKAWVDARRKSKQKGKIALKVELLQKGIDREIIEEVLSEQVIGESEEELAIQALEKKIKKWIPASAGMTETMEFKKKAYEYLSRRGFDYSTISSVVAKKLKKE